jgi:hypothetical protein
MRAAQERNSPVVNARKARCQNFESNFMSGAEEAGAAGTAAVDRGWRELRERRSMTAAGNLLSVQRQCHPERKPLCHRERSPLVIPSEALCHPERSEGSAFRLAPGSIPARQGEANAEFAHCADFAENNKRATMPFWKIVVALCQWCQGLVSVVRGLHGSAPRGCPARRQKQIPRRSAPRDDKNG